MKTKQLFVLLVVILVLASCTNATPTALPVVNTPTSQPAIENTPTPQAAVEEPPTAQPTAESTPTNQPVVEDTPTSQPVALDGAALVQERCTVCHNTSRIEREDEDADGWRVIVLRMVGKGAKLNSEEQAAVIEYLAANYPK